MYSSTTTSGNGKTSCLVVWIMVGLSLLMTNAVSCPFPYTPACASTLGTCISMYLLELQRGQNVDAVEGGRTLTFLWNLFTSFPNWRFFRHRVFLPFLSPNGLIGSQRNNFLISRWVWLWYFERICHVNAFLTGISTVSQQHYVVTMFKKIIADFGACSWLFSTNTCPWLHEQL